MAALSDHDFSAACKEKRLDGDPKSQLREDDVVSLAEQSTVVPSDALEGTSSAPSVWDTANLEDLGSCGVLTSAELRAARMGRLQAQAARPVARQAPARAGASKPVSTAPPSQAGAASRTSRPHAAKQTTAKAPSQAPEGTAPKPMTSSEIRAQRLAQLQRGEEETPAAAVSASAEEAEISLRPVQANPGGYPQRMVSAPAPVAGSELTATLDAMSREALAKDGLWEKTPARNPVTTQTERGAAFHVPFADGGRRFTGPVSATASARSAAQDAEQLRLALDSQSRDAARALGFRKENAPARNPVVKEGGNGAAWHVGFDEYEHSLGGVPQGQASVAKTPGTEQLQRQLDAQSRKAAQAAGFHAGNAPARNPVVKQGGNGAAWHVGFGEYEHTLGGVAQGLPSQAASTSRPARADELTRHLDKQSREVLRDAGLWERTPARNPVVTQGGNGAAWHVDFSN